MMDFWDLCKVQERNLKTVSLLDMMLSLILMISDLDASFWPAVKFTGWAGKTYGFDVYI